MKNNNIVNKDIINKAFESFNDYKILIVGDIMLDTYAWGKVQRISPEAPVPILSYQKQEDKLGGAANVAKNIRSLGATPVLCTVIGDDEKGKRITELFKKHDLSTEGILLDDSRKTTVKTRFLSGFHHLLRLDEEDISYLNNNLENVLYNKILTLLNNNNFHAIIFQDYDKGVLSPSLIEKVKHLAKERNIHTSVDPKKRNFLSYKCTSLFKPNKKEFAEGSGYNIEKNDIEELSSLAQKFRQDQNIKTLLLTLSSDGILVCDNTGCHHIPSQMQEIADVSGAGDTVIATATLCLIAGLPTHTIGELSNIAGGLVCKHPVIVSVKKDELLKEAYNLY